MKSIEQILKEKRVLIQRVGSDGGYAIAYLPGTKKPFNIIFSFGGGWDHVSVSYVNRCPTWDEMCYIKNIFFDEEECVVQYHPPKSEYVNNHPYCLHMWKPQNQELPTPPKEFV